MSNSNIPFPHADGSTPGHEHVDVPNTSMRPEALAAVAPPAMPATDLLKRVADGAHETINRLSASAGPQVQRLDASVAGASDALQAKAAQWRGTSEEWTDSLRSTVREHPLASLLGAVALGVVIARVTR